ncbi:MAG: hypothetical protein NVS3B10_00480 [Polyangiales bacterium]
MSESVRDLLGAVATPANGNAASDAALAALDADDRRHRRRGWFAAATCQAATLCHVGWMALCLREHAWAMVVANAFAAAAGQAASWWVVHSLGGERGR